MPPRLLCGLYYLHAVLPVTQLKEYALRMNVVERQVFQALHAGAIPVYSGAAGVEV